MATNSLVISGGKADLMRSIIEAFGGTPPTSAGEYDLLASIITSIQSFNPPDADIGLAPAGTVAQSFSRYLISSAAEASPGSGDIFMTAVMIPGSTLINAVNFITGSTAAVAPTHQWGGLVNAAYKVVGISADGTSAAIGANAALPFTLGAQYVTPQGPPALYLAFGMIAVTTTMPTFEGATTVAEAMTVPPILNGTANTGETTPPALGTVLTTPTPSATAIYAYVD